MKKKIIIISLIILVLCLLGIIGTLFYQSILNKEEYDKDAYIVYGTEFDRLLDGGSAKQYCYVINFKHNRISKNLKYHNRRLGTKYYVKTTRLSTKKINNKEELKEVLDNALNISDADNKEDPEKDYNDYLILKKGDKSKKIYNEYYIEKLTDLIENHYFND